MSAFIDYSRRGRRGLGSDSESPEGSVGADNSQNPFNEGSQDVHSEVQAANPYASPFSNNASPDYQTRGASDNALRQEQSSHGEGPVRQNQPQPGHHFDVEHVQTTGDTYHLDQEPQEFFDPTFGDYQEEPPLEMVFFDHVVQNYGEMNLFNKGRLFIRQTVSFFATLIGLGAVMAFAFASYFNPFKKSPPRARGDREYERRMTGERFSGKPQYYSNVSVHTCFYIFSDPSLTVLGIPLR